MLLTKEAAQVLLRLIQADAEDKVKTAGGTLWTRIGDSNGGVTLVIKVDCIDENQTTMDEFGQE